MVYILIICSVFLSVLITNRDFSIFPVLLANGFFIGGLVLFSFGTIKSGKSLNFILKISILAYFTRFIIASIYSYFYTTYNIIAIPGIEGDAETYAVEAKKIFELFSDGNFSFQAVSEICNTNLYSAFLGLIAIFFNSSERIIMNFSNCFLGGLNAVLMYILAKKCNFSENRARVATIVFSFLSPLLILFNAAVMKDTLVITLVMASFILYAKVKESKLSPVYLTGMLISLAFLTIVRPYGSGAVLAGILINEYAIRAKNLKRILIYGAVFSTIFIAIIQLGQSFDIPGLSVIIKLMSHVANPESLNNVRNAYYGSGNTTLDFSDLLSLPGGIFLALILGLIYEFFALFPWDWLIGSSLASKLMGVEMIFLYFIYFSMAFGIKEAFKTKNTVAMAMFFYMVANALPYALFVGNMGSYCRLRLQFYPVFIILAGLGGFRGIRRLFGSLENRYKPERVI